VFGNLRGDVSGGLSAAIVTLPVAISCGLVAFAALGPEYAAQGALAGLYAAIFVTILAALFGGAPLQVSGPKSSLAVILAAVLTGLLNDPSLPQDPAQRAAAAMVLIFLCVTLAGGFQIAFGMLKLGNVIKFIPFPVTVGFMNGLAIIIVVSQLPLFFDTPDFNLAALIDGDVPARRLAILIAAVSFAAMWFGRYWLPGGGDAVVALLVGTGVYYFLAQGAGAAGAADLGGLIGRVPSGLPSPAPAFDFAAVAVRPENLGMLWTLVQNAFVLGLLGSIESLLGATAMDAHSDTRHRSNRELIGQGIGNIVSGCFGGLAGGGSPTRSSASYAGGGRTRLAGVVHGLFFLVVVTVAGRVIGMVPLAATAGILFVYALRLAGVWTRQLIVKTEHRQSAQRPDFYLNLAIVVLVTALTVAADLIIAVGAGIALASFLFVVGAGQTPIYRHFRGDNVHSKNARPLEMMAVLKDRGRALLVVEAQGPIFFGSAERLAERVENLAGTAQYIILDFRRVTQVDATGAHILARLDRFMTAREKHLLLSHLSPGQPLWNFLADMDVIHAGTEKNIFPDADTAQAWVENQILTEHHGRDYSILEIPLEDMEITADLSTDQVSVLGTLLVRREFKKGDCIFEEGRDGDAMYFVAAGAVSVRAGLPGSGRLVRLAGIGTGMVFGEMAILADIPRTASIYADEDVVCYALTRAAFQTIGHRHTDIGIQLLLNLGRQSARRLEITSEEVRALENDGHP
jgi:MFS superfamily sulfate permease-like transporter